MRLLAATFVALLAEAVNSMPLPTTANYVFKMVGPAPEFEIKVPNQLYIVFCRDVDFEGPCLGGYVAPGLCYAPPPFGVSAVQPSQEMSGVNLFKSDDCSYSDGVLSNVAYPGIANLGSDGFNDQVNSFIAY